MSSLIPSPSPAGSTQTRSTEDTAAPVVVRPRKFIESFWRGNQAFWRDVHVPGTGEELNMSLERAGRVLDFIEFAELLCLDALTRNESLTGERS